MLSNRLTSLKFLFLLKHCKWYIFILYWSNCTLYFIPFSISFRIIRCAKNTHMCTYTCGLPRWTLSPRHLLSVCAFTHDHELKYLALHNKHEKEFSSLPCKPLVLQNTLILTYLSVLLCAEREKKTA